MPAEALAERCSQLRHVADRLLAILLQLGMALQYLGDVVHDDAHVFQNSRVLEQNPSTSGWPWSMVKMQYTFGKYDVSAKQSISWFETWKPSLRNRSSSSWL